MKVKNITLAALALLLAACGNEEILENNENGNAEKVPMTFTAGIPQTRTSLAEDGYTVNWTEGDRVAIYDGTDKLCEFEATEIEGNTATLSGDAASAGTYTAFYPFETVTTLTNESVTFTLTAAQTAVAGSFAEKLNPSWAQDTDGSHKLTFQNLCALARFTVGIDGVTEVVLTANGDDDALAGSLTYTIAEDKLAATGNASRSVTLKGTFESGQTYYFVVAPGTLVGGITLRYTGGDGKTYVKTTKKEVAFTAGEIADLGNVATDGFSEALNPAFAAALMEKYSNIGLTANPDGTAFLTDGIKLQMSQVSMLKVSGCSLTSLAGIEYFTGLEYLYCYDNSLKSLDVSKLTSLTELLCNDNELETLSLPTTSKLTTLQCHNNALTALDVSKLTGLTSLTCYNNQMEALDITQNTVLEDLYCGQQKKGETDLKLVLTLTDDQEMYWDAVWNEWPENSGVEINSQSTSASATNISFAAGSSVVW